MPEKRSTPQHETPVFSRNVGTQESRKLAVRRSPAHVWPGLGMLGLIGWSVCLPTLVGAWLGQWLDRQHPGGHGWTLPLLVAGLCIGCANAWRWINTQQSAIRRGQGDAE